MTEEVHTLNITVSDLIVDLRTNGDGFEYATVKDKLKALIRTGLDLASATLILAYGNISLEDEVIA